MNSLLSVYKSIYLSLNFYYYQTENTIYAINKYDKNIKIQYTDSNINDISYIENTISYKIIKIQDLPAVYKPFYNLMTHNDISIFLYKTEDNTEYFM